MPELKMPIKPRTVFIIVPLAFIVLTGLSFQGNSQKPSAALTGIQPTVGNLREVIIAKASVNFDHQVSMRTSSGGIVEEILVKEGQELRHGQPLLRIYDQQGEIELNAKNVELRASHAKLQNLEKELLVCKRLVEAGGLPQRELEQKTLERDLAVADSERVALEISSISQRRRQLLLKSPVDGIVTGLPVVRGQLVNVGDEVISLSGGAARKIVAYIDALDVGRIGIGQAVEFSEQEDDGVKRSGRIESISKFASTAQNQNLVKIVIVSADPINDLRLSQQLYMEIVVHEESAALRVPRDLVYEKDGKKIVYVLSQKGIELRNVITTQGDATYDKVVSGIDVNDRLVRYQVLSREAL